MGTPVGVAVTVGGALYYADGSADAVHAIPAGAGTT